jgi:hypothetical protein
MMVDSESDSGSGTQHEEEKVAQYMVETFSRDQRLRDSSSEQSNKTIKQVPSNPIDP